MKRSEFLAQLDEIEASDAARLLAADLAEKAGVTWDPEEPAPLVVGVRGDVHGLVVQQNSTYDRRLTYSEYQRIAAWWNAREGLRRFTLLWPAPTHGMDLAIALQHALRATTVPGEKLPFGTP